MIIKLVRTVFIVGMLVLIGWLAWQDVVPGGQLKAVQDFENKSKYISELYPAARVKEVGSDLFKNEAVRTLIADPVYFDVKAPCRFEKAHVKIIFQNREERPFHLGLKKHKDLWIFDLQSMAGESFLLAESEFKRGWWQRAELTFNLAEIPLIDGKYIFVFSAPKLDQSGMEIKIKRIEIWLEKEAITRQNWGSKTLNRIMRIFMRINGLSHANFYANI